MTVQAATPAKPKWWRWQPVTPAQTVVYLAITALISGCVSVLINRIFSDTDTAAHFVTGVVLGLLTNGLTLWVKRHHHHA